MTVYGLNMCYFGLIVTGAAITMKKACKYLKMNNPYLLNVTCLSHIVHNCEMRINAFYTAVDLFISSIKAITI